MDIVGLVDREATEMDIGRWLELHPPASRWDRINIQVLPFQELRCLRVEGDCPERIGLKSSAPGVGVRDLDQAADGVLAIAHDVGWHPEADRDHLIVRDERPVLVANDVLLN